ncbi:TetR/AcrR family transcriptional regulator [Planosporangium sp. 12N6]|uniref:TetR/AcrR family transcriptional regulator n=1 Tax=Planosporangium spinosum TaxID=3402278 RepID=UPI003CF9B8A4
MEGMEPTATTSLAQPVQVPDELVQAALRAAEELGRDVADIPSTAIAQRAGMSRSTLLRRLGGSRVALHDAVRAAGVDPGGRSVRVRAVEAAALLISEEGLAAATLEAIAGRAGCAVESLYAVFGNRDTLLGAVFDQYSPIVDIGDVLAAEHTDLRATVAHVYRTMAEVLTQEPRVTPAIFAEMLARPTSAAVQSLLRHKAPRLFTVIGEWLSAEIRAGRVRDVPLPLLLGQFVAPVVIHMLLRPAMSGLAFIELPDVEQTCDVFADAFVRAVAVDPGQ